MYIALYEKYEKASKFEILLSGQKVKKYKVLIKIGPGPSVAKTLIAERPIGDISYGYTTNV